MPTMTDLKQKLKEHHPWLLVLWLWGAFFLAYVTRQSIFSIFPILRETLGFTEVQLGLTGTVFLWAYALGNPVGGYLSDRLSKKKLIVTSLLLWSICVFVIGSSESANTLLTWRGVLALAQSLYIVAAISLITETHTEFNRSKALSLHGTAQFAGIAFGGWYGGFMSEALDWRWMLWLVAMAGVAYAPMLSLGMGKSKPSSRIRLEAAKCSSLRILTIPSYALLCFNFIAINAMLWVIYAWLPDFLHQKFQLSLAASGWTATFYVQSATIVGILAGASIADQLVQRSPRGRVYVLLVGLTMACPFFYGVGHGESLSAVKAAAMGYGFFKGACIANFFASVIDIVPMGNRGFAIGFSNMIGSISGGLASYLVGFLKARFASETLFTFATALGAAAVLALTIMIWKLFPADHRRAHSQRSEFERAESQK